MTVKINKNYLNDFYRAILSLSSEEECARFFEDIFTFGELEAVVQRLQVAKLLTKGKSYVDINKETGASTATICRVSKCLNYGDGGYKSVLNKIGEEK